MEEITEQQQHAGKTMDENRTLAHHEVVVKMAKHQQLQIDDEIGRHLTEDLEKRCVDLERGPPAHDDNNNARNGDDASPSYSDDDKMMKAQQLWLPRANSNVPDEENGQALKMPTRKGMDPQGRHQEPTQSPVSAFQPRDLESPNKNASDTTTAVAALASSPTTTTASSVHSRTTSCEDDHDDEEQSGYLVEDYREPGVPEPSRRRILWKPLLGLIVLAVIVVVLAVVLTQPSSSNGRGGSSSTAAPPTTSNGLNRSQEVIDFLIEARISYSGDLEMPNTPQHKAAVWIADQDLMRLPIPDPMPSLDDNNANSDITLGNSQRSETFVHRYVLAVLYFALNSEGTWPNGVNFLTAQHVCEWTMMRTIDDDASSSSSSSSSSEVPLGVYECIENELGEQVPSALSLSFHGLVGTVPDEMRHLTQLTAVDLSYNPAIGGTMPPSLRAMTNLQNLALNHCSIRGEIPEWIGELVELKYLTLGNNKLTGTVPPTIQTLYQLEVLGLDDNSLSANLDIFGFSNNLLHLYLDKNRIRGSLTSFLLAQWPKLEVLDASENKISSTLPLDLFSHPTLRVIDLHGNAISGRIPSVTGLENSSLEFLALQSNAMDGSIPESLSLLSSLKHLDLAKNQLTSTIPASLSDLTLLKYLFLGDNNFLPESFPPQIKFLTNLEELSLQNAGLIGSLPGWIDQLTALVYLDLSSNFLSGSMPESFGRLSDLRFLLLRDNKFSSTIPNSFADLANLDLLLLEGNTLTGNANGICLSGSVRPEMFVSDCGDPNADLECECCTECCSSSSICNDNDWYAHVDSTWEMAYQRDRYVFGRGVTFGEQCIDGSDNANRV